jgi:ABC-type sugar transport system substrate-binding protein
MTEEWQVELNYRILQSLRRARLLPIVFSPSESHTLSERQELLSDILVDAKEFAGGLAVVPGWPSNRFDELMRFATRFAKPVVFIDQNPSASANMPANARFVSVKDQAGGRLAAEAALEIASARSIARVLTVNGFAKQGRVDAFIASIKRKIPRLEITVSEDGFYDRDVTAQLTNVMFGQALLEQRPFDLVFCAADSMTLGCLDAIDCLKERGLGPLPLVIGYDGVRSTRILVEGGSSQLARIVVQDTREIARVAVEQLNDLFCDGQASRISWVEPYLLPRRKTMSSRKLDRSALAELAN